MKKLIELQIKRIADSAARELGPSASKEKINQIVSQVVAEIERGAPSLALNQIPQTSSGRVIVTAFGKNSPGILFSITSVLHEKNCDVLDVSQNIMTDFFTLIMIVDLTTSSSDFFQLKNSLNEVSEKIGIQIHVQHEDIFKSMHRI